MSDQNQKPEVVQGIKEVFGNLPAASVAVSPAVTKDPAAVALGLKSYGKPKTLSDEERSRRSDHMKRVTAERVARRQAPSPVQQTGPVIPAPNTAPVSSAPSSAPSPTGTGTRVVSTGQPVKRPMRYVSKGVAPSSRAYPPRQSR